MNPFQRFVKWCQKPSRIVTLEYGTSKYKLPIFPVVSLSTLVIMGYLLIVNENANVPAVIVAITLCGVIVYYNWKAYRRDGQRPYDPVKLPFRKGEFKSNREPEETFEWDSLNRPRDNLGVPWALEYFGNPDNEELQAMNPEFKEFLVVCRRYSALNLTLKQIADEKEITPNEEQQKFLMSRAEESRRLIDQILVETRRTQHLTMRTVLGGLGGGEMQPKFSDRFQELRKKQINLEKEVVDYVIKSFENKIA
jgi:hypothetical protein